MSQKFYAKSTQVDGLPQDNKIRYHFYKNSPPPIFMVVIKIVRVIRVRVDMCLTPPLGGGWKIKNNFNFALTGEKLANRLLRIDL